MPVQRRTDDNFPLALIKPHPDNPRKRSRQQVRKLGRAIEKFGFTSPFILDENGVILAGHGRFLAAHALNLETVPVVMLTGLTEDEKTAYRIADNRLADESSFDLSLLAPQSKALIDVGFEMEYTGLDAIELDLIVAEGMPSTITSDPPLPPFACSPVARENDVWLADKHLVVCGDCRDSWTFAKLLGLKKADMVFMDPPYNVRIAGHVSGNGATKHDEFRMASGEMSEAEFQDFLKAVLSHCRAFSRDGSLHYACIDWRGIADLVHVGRGIFARLMNIAVWAKPNGGMGSFYRSQHEMCAVFKHGQAPHVNNVQLGRLKRYRSNLWQYPGGSGFSKSRKQDLEDHPTVKPIALVADAIRDATAPGDLVLDPFGGAGTTLLAAEITGRRAALIEIEPKFVDVTLRRFQDHTGVEPVLLPDRKPLSVVRAERGLTAEDKA